MVEPAASRHPGHPAQRAGGRARQGQATSPAGRSTSGWPRSSPPPSGPVLSGQYRLMIRAEREKATERKKNDEIEIAPVHRRRDRRHRRGTRRRDGHGAGARSPRWWEDVEEGDEIPPLVKGPLRVTDMVVWHTGMGMGLYGVKALRLAYDQRQRMPRFFKPDDLNIPDVQQRVHWDPEWAHRAGNPACYDYGRMRETWLIHLCTDWMGDDAWLWKLDCQFRKFNYVGRHPLDAGTGDPQVPRRGRSTGGRPRHLGRQPTGRDHHPGPRHDPPALARARRRPRCPTRRAEPPPARRRSTRSPSASRPRSKGEALSGHPSRARRRTRRPGPALCGSTGRNAATASPTPSSTRSPTPWTPPPATSPCGSSTSRVTGDHFCSGFDLAERTPGPDRPRVGSVHRRMNGHVNRLIPADADLPDTDRLHRPRVGHRPGSRPPPRLRTSPWWPTTPGCGHRSRRSASRPTAAPPGSFPVWPAWPGPGRCSFWGRRSRSRRRLVGAGPPRRARSPTWTGPSEGARRPAGGGTDRRDRAHQAAAAPGATTDINSHLADEAWAMEVSSRSEDFQEYGEASKEKRAPRFTGR